MKTKIKKVLFKIDTFRRIVQFVFFTLFTAVIFMFGAMPILLPVLWTWGLSPNGLGDAFTAIQLMLSGWKLPTVVFPWLALASFFSIGVLLGKSLCGWICPFGFIQDIIDLVRNRKAEISHQTHKSMLYIKYFVLGITLLISLTFSASKFLKISANYEKALGIFAYAPFTALSPAETLFATLPKTVMEFYKASLEKPFAEVLAGILNLTPLFWVQLFILVGFIVLSIYVKRGWCKYLCPHGSIMAVINRFSFLGLRRELTKCVKGECRECVKACPMRVDILDLPWEKINDPECIYCLKCVDACPNKAVKIKYL